MTDEQQYSAAIRTPDQRLRVFVSSTLAELADERGAVSRAISALRLTPVLFELGARPHPPRELYRAYLAQSDIFIGLYWQRYGWVGPGMDISGLEDEFRLSGSMPRLLYVKAPAPEREPGLAAMLAELASGGSESYRTFRSSRELGRLVRDDLALLMSERFAVKAGPVERALPAAGVARPPRSLPAISTSLIGRETDVAAVAELFAKPEVRLVTLTGPGGIGKTRLAIAVAERLDERYARGAVFVPLESIARPAEVLPRIAAALGAPIEGARPALDVLVEHLAGTPALLVLDNLEQIVAIAPELDRLLARCPGLAILATSRTPLRLRAEREYPVSPLSVPAFADEPALEPLGALPAVQLFVDRAQTVRHGFALTKDNALAIAEICRRLDGLPLAIELAAARTRLLEPRALLARLETRLDALGQGPVDLPERQRTLRATVEWSVALLDPRERHVLATLSVFVEGCTVEAAMRVTDLPEEETLDRLDALAGHSLLGVDATGAEPRFRMLASIRELAAEHLAARADQALVRGRHAEYFGALVENADWPAERQAEWAARMRSEEGNLAAAIRWFLAHDIAPLPHMFRILWLFWQMRDRMPEGRAWIRELQTRSALLDDRARAELSLIACVTAVEVGDDESALAALEELRGLEGRLGDPHLESSTQLALSWVLPLVGDLEGALRAASSAREGFRERSEPYLGWAALTVGLLEMRLGRLEAARASLTEAEELGAQFGNHWLEAASRALLASLAVEAGSLGEARARLAASVRAEDDAQLSAQTLTFSLAACARLALAEGDARRAALALGAAEGLRQRAGLKTWPSLRGDDSELAARSAGELEREAFQQAFAAGSQWDRRGALAFVREGPAARERE